MIIKNRSREEFEAVQIQNKAQQLLDQAITWEHDYENRISPELMTRLLHKAVPVLQATDWKITEVGYGYCESRLPLNAATTNQHGTHQAALISLSADYTGGMALTTLLRGAPLSGIHPGKSPNSISLWLASMNVKYLNPSTGHLIGRCTISDSQAEKIVSRFRSGKRILVALPIEFESNGEIVAEAELKYFAQPTRQLMDVSDKASALFTTKAKASARMIAGVRASSMLLTDDDPDRKQKLRVDCKHAGIAAGPHGELLAGKLKKALPQLSDMVMARTKHSDLTVQAIPNLKQVVMVGAGLDMRPFRNVNRTNQFCETESPAFFEIDLPEMLVERERVIAGFEDAIQPKRISIPANFLKDNLFEKLNKCREFDANLPTVFIYEGCSMYFGYEVNRKIIRSIGQLMNHPDSRIWIDFVSRNIIDRQPSSSHVRDFLQRMTEMGESFIFGVDHPEHLLADCGLTPQVVISTLDYLGPQSPVDDPILDLYWFTESRMQR